MKHKKLYLTIASMSLATVSLQASAQQEAVIEEVIVTGSYIPGTPEDAAVPVDVVTADEMSRLGSPDMLEYIKTLNVSAGVLGSSNQFDGKSQGSDGVGSINLRGLGQSRTLVLVNGRRVATNPFTDAVDTNMLPLAAMGRLEILKEGAAVLYGSDAIAGVVNFITKKDFEGFEIGYDHTFISDSRGDDTVRANWGWVGDASNVLVSAGYQRRSRLSVADRDWGLLPQSANPQGGWSGGGNPSGFISFAVPSLFDGAPAGTPLEALDTPALNNAGHFRDPGCAALGGTELTASYDPTITPPTLADFLGGDPTASSRLAAYRANGTVPRCQFEYTPFDNIVDPQERYQLFSEYNLSITDDIEFHIEGMFSHTETEYYTSPSYLATQSPTLTGSVFLVSEDHPGMVDFVNTYGETQLRSDGTGGSSGSVDSLVIPGLTPLGMPALTFRPYAMGGNPLYGFDAAQTEREYDQYRVSTGFNGTLADSIQWDVALTYSQVKATRRNADTVVDRFQAALYGLGGPNCNPLAGGTAFDSSTGCLTYSPFSTSVRFNALTGAQNPNFVNAYDNENPELIEWMFVEHWLEDTSTNLTFDAVFNGGSGIELGGGEILWAAGLQYREDTYKRELDEFNNLENYGCPSEVATWLSPAVPCSAATEGSGPFFFLGGNTEADLDGDVYAVFGELRLPILDNLEMQLAARYEDYGGETGDTFDPKIAARWQPIEWLAFRGSFSSTFRAPPINALTDDSTTSLQNINNTFRPIDNFGDPALQPEEADSINVGVIVDTGNFFGSLDYWFFDFANPITVDPLTPMVEALFGPPNGAGGAWIAGTTGNCGVAGYEGLQSRFTFANDTCSIDNIRRVRTDTVNGSARETDGLDLKLSYTWDLADSAFTLGSQATYVMSHEFEDVSVEGILVEQGRDAVGFLNAQTTAWPLPELKGDVYGEYSVGNANYRLVGRYIDSYIDQRFDQTIEDQTTFDFHYRYLWNTDATETSIVVSIENLTDEDPPFARLDLDYDTFTHNPLGRTIKVGFTTTF